MARTRTIRPEFWSDEKIGDLSLVGRLLFIGMWTFADDEGLLRANPLFLRATIFPYDVELKREEIESSLKRMEELGLIYRYRNNDQDYLWITKFRVYQKIDKPQKPHNPAPKCNSEEYRKAIFRRDSFKCHSCGALVEYREHDIAGEDKSPGDDIIASVDHIRPRSDGGSDYPTNLVTCCLKCNKSIDRKDLRTFGEYSPNGPGRTPEPSDKGSDETRNKKQETGNKKQETEDKGTSVPLSSPDGSDPVIPTENPPGNGKGHPPPCPVLKIVERYHDILPNFARVQVIDKITRANIRNRWAEDPQRWAFEWWDDFFNYVGESDFLSGRKTDFKANFTWLMGPKNFAKVLNGAYDNHRCALGPKAQRNMAAAEAVKRMIDEGKL